MVTGPNLGRRRSSTKYVSRRSKIFSRPRFCFDIMHIYMILLIGSLALSTMVSRGFAPHAIPAVSWSRQNSIDGEADGVLWGRCDYREDSSLRLFATKTKVLTELPTRISTESSDMRQATRRRPLATVTPGPGVKITRASSSVVVASEEENKESLTDTENPIDDGDDSPDSDEESENGDAASGRNAAVVAALLRRSASGRRRVSPDGAGKTSSVGTRRVGSATRARQAAKVGGGLAGRVLGTVRTAAAAAAAARSNKETAAHESVEAVTNSTATEKDSSSTLSLSDSRGSKPIIQSVITDILQRQDEVRKNMEDEPPPNTPSASASYFAPPLGMGVLGEPTSYGPSPAQNLNPTRHPYPGAILIHPTIDNLAYVPSMSSPPEAVQKQMTVRVATPCDDATIALLRLSVFSDFTPDLRHKFCERSCEVLNNRRLRGATCLVASVPNSVRSALIDGISSLDEAPRLSTTTTVEKEWIIGSVECSVHEFHGTLLGRSRPIEKVLYITEVAVSPQARRCGAGSMLLKGIDELAAIRQVETLYLHVDVRNEAALSLYEKAGYAYVDKSDRMFAEFTTSLNLHDGATKGRRHHLLYKNLTGETTWLLSRMEGENTSERRGSTLGFEIAF